MYIEKLKLKNFRKFKDLEIEFNKGLNLFLGPNDSGKTAIIDGLKLVLGTASNDYYRIQNTDFFKGTQVFKIEAFITDFTDGQASKLLDWGGLDDKGNFCIKIIFESKKSVNNSFHTSIKAGTYESEDGGTYLEAEVKDLIRAVYLKPLRNAEMELTSGRNSRLSQILLSHPLLLKDGKEHDLEKLFSEMKKQTEKYFNEEKESPRGKKYNLTDDINDIFKKLLEKDKGLNGNITLDASSLESIVKNLNLLIGDTDKRPGLGTSNLLLIATELLLLEELKNDSLGCALIEEIEAHIHPQGQIRLINYLEDKVKDNLQIFITSHSPNIASKVNIKNIFICRDDNIYSMSEEYTGLGKDDYKHLGRFLDVTKANLFFAKGLIFVEGIAEALIIPEIAKILEIDLDFHGISIINVNGLSFDRYLKAFIRKKGPDFNIKISVITDRDFRGIQFSFPEKDSDFLKGISEKKYILEKEDKKKKKYYTFDKKQFIDDLIENQTIDEIYQNNIIDDKKYYSKIQTLEYDLGLSCLSDKLLEARKKVSTIQKEKELITAETNKYKKAYNLYKKIEKNKGETAQELAEILSNLPEKEKNKLKTEIESDDYLKYIVEAIKNVTE